MTAGDLLAGLATGLGRGQGLRLETRPGRVTAFVGDEVAVDAWVRGDEVEVATAARLEARPRQGPKVRHLADRGDGLEHCLTASAWHLAGIAASIVRRTDRELRLPNQLSAALSGRVRARSTTEGDPEFWTALAHWAKETEFLDPRGRVFAHRYGDYLDRGVPASDAYRRWAVRTAKAAIAAGFVPPSKLG